MSEKAKPAAEADAEQPAAELMKAPKDEGPKLGPEIDAAHAGGGSYIAVGNGKVRKVLS